MQQTISFRHLRTIRNVKQIVDGEHVSVPTIMPHGGLTFAYTINKLDEEQSVIEFTWAKCRTTDTFVRENGADIAAARWMKRHAKDENVTAVVDNDQIRSGYIVTIMKQELENQFEKLNEKINDKSSSTRSTEMYAAMKAAQELQCVISYIKKNRNYFLRTLAVERATA